MARTTAIIRHFTPVTATAWLLLLATVLHGLGAYCLGLSVDEAHYALYGQYLAWSYFDHPPLVGWLQAPILYFSHSSLALRLWAMVVNIALSVTVYRAAQLLFPNTSRWLPFVSVLLTQACLLFNILGMMWLPQVPFLLFAFLSLLQLYRIVAHEKKTWLSFIALGIFLGLAALSEYTAIFLVIALFIFVLSTQPRLFLCLKLWLAGLIALLCCWPIIYWNLQHQWTSMGYQSNHIFNGAYWSISSFLQSQLLEFFIYTPLLYILGIVVLVQGWQKRHTVTIKWLYSLTLPFFLIFAFSNGFTVVLAHWPALGFLILIPFVAHYIMQNWYRRWVRILSIGTSIYCIILLLFLYTQALFHWLYLPLGQDPFIDLYGWPQASQVALKELHAIPVRSPKNPPMLFVPNWSLASRLAWYSRQPVQVAQYEKLSQFAIWFGPPTIHSYGILMVPIHWNDAFDVGMENGAFTNCHFLHDYVYQIHGHAINRFQFYYCEQFHNP